MAPPKPETQLVKVSDLKDDMVILSFVAFSRRYQSMNDMTCEWVKLNFKGTSAVVERDGQRIHLTVDQMKSGDTLRRLFKFPPSLRKLTIVNPRLIAELKKRGFLGFQVTRRQPVSKSGHRNRQRQLDQTRYFIDTVEKSAAQRDRAAAVVEDLMDNARKGEMNILELMDCIDNITEESSSVAISAVAALKKSDQTYAHCVDVAAIFQTAYSRIIESRQLPSRFKDENEMLMGAFMHDFGKSKLPKEILDSSEIFDPDGPEMTQMRKHPELGAEILNNIRMPEPIVNLARLHHVKVDMTLQASYPKIDGYDRLSLEDRLLGIVDTYQALVGRRSYKKARSAPAAITYLDQIAGIELDAGIWEDFVKVMGRYPVGSLVQLNDGSRAFVTSVPPSDLDRPQVVVVENKNGDRLSHHDFIDLADDRDVSIAKGLDSMQVLGEDALDFFVNLQIA